MLDSKSIAGVWLPLLVKGLLLKFCGVRVLENGELLLVNSEFVLHFETIQNVLTIPFNPCSNVYTDLRRPNQRCVTLPVASVATQMG